jgi:hypothetical protein
MTERTGCLICGTDIEYLRYPEPLRCTYCGKVFESLSRCKEGHYVCDACHRLSGEDLIEQFCISTGLLAGYANVRGEGAQKERWIQMARQRAEMIKGGSCGILGDCGAAVGTGIFISIITAATPLSEKEWQQANLMTAESLKRIAIAGGPRCCKRNTFLAILTAVDFVKEHFHVILPVRVPAVCEWSPLNKECKGIACPFYEG